jgi:hypothetical protein
MTYDENDILLYQDAPRLRELGWDVEIEPDFPIRLLTGAAFEEATRDAALFWRGGEKLREMGRKLTTSGGIPLVATPRSFTAELRPYQAQGVAWLSFLRELDLGGVLADDMGLGKTVQALALIAIEKAAGRLTTPALVVAPTSLIGQLAARGGEVRARSARPHPPGQ